MKRLLDVDPLTGIQTFFEYDPKTGKNTIETVQDVEPLIERSKLVAGNLDKKQDWWPIGTIPDSMIIKWSQECGAKPYSKEWHEYAMKQLNSAEYAKLNPNRVKL